MVPSFLVTRFIGEVHGDILGLITPFNISSMWSSKPDTAPLNLIGIRPIKWEGHLFPIWPQYFINFNVDQQIWHMLIHRYRHKDQVCIWVTRVVININSVLTCNILNFRWLAALFIIIPNGFLCAPDSSVLKN